MKSALYSSPRSATHPVMLAPHASRLEKACFDKGLKLTGQRRVIARVLSEATDHPDVNQVFERAVRLDSKISIATVYRTVRLFEEAGILQKHEFGQGKARYEEADNGHHDHLIDIDTGTVVEFFDAELETLKTQIAARLGFDLVDHRLELYARKKKA
jgi:Fur family ferric uptake transcriptional regulator